MNYYDRVKRQHGIYFNLLSKYNLHPLKKITGFMHTNKCITKKTGI